MTNIVSSLFGPSPIEVMQQQQARIDTAADRYATQQPFQRAAGQMFRGGAGLARPIAGMLGLEDPQADEARVSQAIMSQVDVTTSDGLAQGASMANRMGQPRLAFLLAQAAQKRKTEETAENQKIAAANLSNARAKALSYGSATQKQQLAAKQAIARDRALQRGMAAGLSGDDLDAYAQQQVDIVTQEWIRTVGGSDDSGKTSTPSVRIDSTGLPVSALSPDTSIEAGKSFSRDELDAMKADAAERGDSMAVAALSAMQPKIAIGPKPKESSKQPIQYIDKNGQPVWGTIDEARGQGVAGLDPKTKAAVASATETGKSGAEMNVKEFVSAKNSADNIQKIDATLTHLKSSQAITGLGADIQKNIERAKALLGDKVASGRASDTEILDVLMGSDVFPMVGSLGIGAKGMDTPAEREFMRSVLTGTISLNRDTLIRMTEIRKSMAQREIDRWDARVDKGELDKFFEQTGRERTKFGNKKPSLPAADQEALDWANANQGDPRSAKIKQRLGLQ